VQISYQITHFENGQYLTKTFPMDGVAFLQANLDDEQINKVGSIIDNIFSQLGWPSTALTPPNGGDRGDDEAPPPRRRKRKRRNRKRVRNWRKPDVVN